MSDNNKREDNIFADLTDPSTTAEEFLQKLDLANERWHGGGPWVFRGHNDSSWELTPSLFRTPYEEIEPDYEFDLIDSFIRHLNLANMKIPANTMSYVEFRVDDKPVTARSLRYPSGSGHVYDFTHVVFAIAQHSGIPTRLLDFTYDPTVAAWFAVDYRHLFDKLEMSAESKAKVFEHVLQMTRTSIDDAVAMMFEYMRVHNASVKDLPDNIAVWAVRTSDLLEITTLRLLDHPYAEISNLQAQKGAFLIDTAFHEIEKGAWQSFDNELSKLIETGGIRKLTLPKSEIKNLRIALFRRRVAGMFLVPTYEAVASYVMKESEEWSKDG